MSSHHCTCLGLEGQGKGQQGGDLPGSELAAGSRQIHIKGSISRPLVHLCYAQDWAFGAHWVNQRTTRAVSEAVFYAIGVSGMTEEEMCPEKENSHLKKGLVCQEYHKE